LDEDGDVFYYEASRDKSTYEHPCDAYFKWMYIALKRQSMVSYCAQLTRGRLDTDDAWSIGTPHILCQWHIFTLLSGVCLNGLQAARKIQRFMRARRARARQERRLVRQTVRAIRLPSYTPPRRLEEV
jgi:hypothetical protein